VARYVVRYTKVHIELDHHQGPLEERQIGPPGRVNLKRLTDRITVIALTGNCLAKNSCLENLIDC
jgi:hypothetical protein